jgi:hypothetical protein
VSQFDIPVAQNLIQTTRFHCISTALSLFNIDQFSSFRLDIIIEGLSTSYRLLSNVAIICNRFRRFIDSTLNQEDSMHKLMIATIAVIGMFSGMPQMAQADDAKAKMESMKGEVKAKGQEAKGETKALIEEAQGNKMSGTMERAKGKTKAAGERIKGKAKELKAKTE